MADLSYDILHTEFYTVLPREILMFFNYFKIAFRNILKHKGYSFINILGLAVGMSCFTLIAFLVLDEFRPIVLTEMPTVSFA